ncbi:ABC transporter permease [Hoyosella subflava]|uniref:ABC lipoprotein transporter, permease component n=1 Tax=Hoyosella subflava (strain DSM 45089 / JCM 17490 / NBRC 109087 / DQS3-9A1) TaxID=443218 RepID=F6EKG6_HOYSD|nr:FtsX-like permease family protein [Hoyosella subflava]AEF39137.1 ABC lipoprotein transporter, permease component [Hoyosella subflava DQS3-9A1]
MAVSLKPSGAPMRKVSTRNLMAHKLRLFLTVLAVVLGTAFVTGSFVFTDTLKKTFDEIFSGDTIGVDVRVTPAQEGSLGIPIEEADRLADLPNVRASVQAASGQVILIKDGSAVQTGGAPSIGQTYLPPNSGIGQPIEIVEGTVPEQAGDIIVNQSGAERGDIAVGDALEVLVPNVGSFDVTVTGTYSLPVDVGGFVGVQFTAEQARELFTDGEHVSRLDLAAVDGVSQEQLRDEVAAAVPDGYTVETGEEARAQQQSELEENLSFINYFLLAFGAIALVVGTFIIYNTFAMIVAQRLREMALLRAIGASRRQISRSVIFEALIVGVIGSAIGLGCGVALAYTLRVVMDAFDLGLPSGTLALEPRTVIAAFTVGILVTVLSAYAPARRASRVPPVAAMREEFSGSAESVRTRTIIGALLGVPGLVALFWGMQYTGQQGAIIVGLGVGLLILAVLFATPGLAQPAIRLLGFTAKPFGSIGKLARTNAVRNPRRTAATAFALTLGLMLVTMISVLGTSAKVSIDALIDQGIEADFILSGPMQTGVPAGVTQSAERAEGVERAAAVNFATALVGEDEERIVGAGVLGGVGGILSFDMVEGSATLGDSSMLVDEATAEKFGWSPGDEVELTRPSRDGTVNVTVEGIYTVNQLVGSMVLSDGALNSLIPRFVQVTAAVMVRADSAADPGTVRTALEDATEQFVVVQVQDLEEYKSAQSAQVDMILALLYALLALAVVIAILGIVNTLALSVVERKREIGMLRAVGMFRQQVRRTIYIESALIAVFGAVLGLSMGLLFGWGFVRTLRDEGLTIVAVPWVQVVAMLVGSAIVGVLAALWPAGRAARTKPLEAIADM